MSNTIAESPSLHAKSHPHAAMFIIVAIVWLALDVLTKRMIIDGGYEVGSVFAGPFLGIIDFRLVHNTGAAWGLFSDSTMALAIFSIIVCLLLVLFAFTLFKDDPAPIHFGLALVVAGGIGNVIDRLSFGYVIDFIEATFIEFPVFNIADIGVTCGFVIVLITVFYSMRHKRCGYAEAKRGLADETDEHRSSAMASEASQDANDFAGIGADASESQGGGGL